MSEYGKTVRKGRFHVREIKSHFAVKLAPTANVSIKNNRPNDVVTIVSDFTPPRPSPTKRIGRFSIRDVSWKDHNTPTQSPTSSQVVSAYDVKKSVTDKASADKINGRNSSQIISTLLEQNRMIMNKLSTLEESAHNSPKNEDNALSDLIEQLRGEVEKHIASKKRSDSELKRLRFRNRELEEKVASDEGKCSTLESKAKEMKQKCSRLLEENHSLRNRLKQANSRNAELVSNMRSKSQSPRELNKFNDQSTIQQSEITLGKSFNGAASVSCHGIVVPQQNWPMNVNQHDMSVINKTGSFNIFSNEGSKNLPPFGSVDLTMLSSGPIGVDAIPAEDLRPRVNITEPRHRVLTSETDIHSLIMSAYSQPPQVSGNIH